MVCKQCGNSIKSDFKYCPYCGERMVSDFHDQFHDLTPPFVIRDVQEDGEALYGEPPEVFPVFEEAPPEFDRRQVFSEPDPEPEDYSYPPPRFARPPELDYDQQEPDYSDLDDAPYIVYHPEGAAEPPRQARVAAPRSGYRTAAEKQPRAPIPNAPQEHSGAGMGIGMKLAAILITLMLAGGISVVGYRLLMPAQPFSHPAEDGASFASVLLL